MRTDLILSAEIIAITIGTIAGACFFTQLSVLVLVAVGITVGVYGLVAGIVKLDDAGLYLVQQQGEGFLSNLQRRIGGAILGAAPWLMKGLSLAGTVALFLVGGGIVLHGIPGSHHLIGVVFSAVDTLPFGGGLLGAIAPALLNGVSGLAAGALTLFAVTVGKRLWMSQERLAD